MTTREPRHHATMPASARGEGLADSFSLFALIVMSTFAVAIAVAIVGLAAPAWLGFS